MSNFDGKGNQKSFDNIIENDFNGNFHVEVVPKCFNFCINKISEEDFTKTEKLCLLDCFSKSYVSFSSFNNQFQP
jgi:hypothetical protein